MNAIEWFKGTVTGEQALKGEGYKDIDVLIKIAKKEVFDDIWSDEFEGLDRPVCDECSDIINNFWKSMKKLKKRHLSTKTRKNL